jgi:tRNA 2-thiocytidine biosynthesis protein TtcA
MGTLTVNQNKLQKRLRRLAGEAVADFNMIEDGDKVMVCLSGGKDSYTMLDVLLHLQKVAPIKFEIVAVNMDQKQPGFPSTCCRPTSKSWASSTTSSRKTPTRWSRS